MRGWELLTCGHAEAVQSGRQHRWLLQASCRTAASLQHSTAWRVSDHCCGLQDHACVTVLHDCDSSMQLFLQPLGAKLEVSFLLPWVAQCVWTTWQCDSDWQCDSVLVACPLERAVQRVAWLGRPSAARLASLCHALASSWLQAVSMLTATHPPPTPHSIFG